MKNAAEDTEGLAERRAKTKKAAQKGDRTGGAPVAPTGVPKGDHVAAPLEAPQSKRTDADDEGLPRAD